MRCAAWPRCSQSRRRRVMSGRRNRRRKSKLPLNVAKACEIRTLKLDEVSVVDRPACAEKGIPRAVVALTKRDTGHVKALDPLNPSGDWLEGDYQWVQGELR